MPRDGSQEYHAPFPDVVEGTTIESTVYNGFVNDIVIDLNTPRPVKYGGTGADNSADAMQNLGGELAKQLVTNYDVHPFQAGSFYSAAGASGAPTGNAFTGICYVAVVAGVPTTDMFIEARDQTTGLLYVRQKKANVWGGWTVPAGFSPGATPPAGSAPNALWWDTTRGKLFFYYQDPSGPPAQWVEAVAVPDIDPNTFVEIAGDSMTGFLTLNANAVNPLHAVPKQQLDARFTGLYAAPFDALVYNGMQINGGMDVSQELGLASFVLATGFTKYVVDGWQALAVYTVGSLTVKQEAVSAIGTGFASRAVSLAGSPAVTSVAAGDLANIYQLIEGYRVARLAWGTVNAQPLTVGFWVFSGTAGHFSVAVRNGGVTRSYVVDVTVAANTWEYKTVTIPGDTTGGWQKDNTTGLILSFNFMCGSAYQTTGNVWAGGNFVSTPAATNLFNPANTIYITNVVVLPGIEAPSAARSPLIMRPYDQELVTCQRYWQKSYDYATAPGTATVVSGLVSGLADTFSASLIFTNAMYKVRMRASPTVLLYSYAGTANRWTKQSGNPDTAAASMSIGGENGFSVISSSGLTVGAGHYGHYTADARL